MSAGGGSRSIDSALAEISWPPANGESARASEQPCQGAKFHSPSPLFTTARHIDGAEIYLCGTCSDNLSAFMTLHNHYGGDVPWPILREFGNQLRSLGRRLMGQGEPRD